VSGSASTRPLLAYPAVRVAGWQLLASAVAALGSGLWAGWQGVLSGFLGGIVNVSAGIVFAMLVRLGRPETAAATIRTMLRAEMAKIAVIVLLLWLVLTTYRDVVHGAFFAAFVVTVFVSQAAILIRD
jgi:ATP synthase protein I